MGTDLFTVCPLTPAAMRRVSLRGQGGSREHRRRDLGGTTGLETAGGGGGWPCSLRRILMVHLAASRSVRIVGWMWGREREASPGRT